jgi:uncharacterized protein (DUF1015 family)
MAKLKPFIFFSPPNELANDVAIDSYDSYSKEQVNEIIHNHELSFINVIHKEADMHRSDFYALVRKRFLDFIKKGWLQPSSKPSFVLYKKTSLSRSYFGIIALSDLRDLNNGIIHLHENTIEKRENILAQYIKEVKLNAEPVALVYDRNIGIQNIVQRESEKSAFLKYKDAKNELHELWEIADGKVIAQLQKEFEKVNYLLVADGHHRIKSSWRNFQENKGEPYFMSILFDEDNIDIQPYQEGGKKYTFQEIKSITQRGEVLPPKSTWILPKLKTGLVVYDINIGQ